MDDSATAGLVARIGDRDALDALIAERAVVAALGGGCQMPIGAHAIITGDRITLAGVVMAPDGSRAARATVEGPRSAAGTVGREAAERLLAGGADDILARHPRGGSRGQLSHMKQTAVSLIGAGPGDPGLITVQGLACLQRADVVIYDHLVSPRLLLHARRGAELIDVGASAPQPMEQEAISYLHRRKGPRGQAGGAAQVGRSRSCSITAAKRRSSCSEHGIPFEVVPGVPAGIGVPAYAGVPVSYPGGGDTITLVRGFEDASRTPPDIDWSGLARLEGTVVCYAGAQQLPLILEALARQRLAGRRTGGRRLPRHDCRHRRRSAARLASWRRS